MSVFRAPITFDYLTLPDIVLMKSFIISHEDIDKSKFASSLMDIDP